MSETINAIVAAVAAATTDKAGFVVTDEDGNESVDMWAWRAGVARKATEIKAEFLGERSDVMNRLAELDNAVAIVGTVAGIAPSDGNDKRAIITLYTGTDQTDDGYETLRTEWITNERGASEVHRTRELMGHRVVAFKETVEMKGRTGKVRMCRYLRDLGPDRDWEVVLDSKGRASSAEPI